MTVVTFGMSKIDAFGGFAKCSNHFFFSSAVNYVSWPLVRAVVCNDQRQGSVTLAVQGWHSCTEKLPKDEQSWFSHEIHAQVEMASSGLCQVTASPCSGTLPIMNSTQTPVHLCSDSSVFCETETEQLRCDPNRASPSWDAFQVSQGAAV